MATMPAVVPSPSSSEQGRVVGTWSMVGRPPARRRTSSRMHDQHDVVEHRGEGRRGEALAAVEQRGADGGEPVEEHLRGEQQQQRDGHRRLSRPGVVLAEV